MISKTAAEFSTISPSSLALMVNFWSRCLNFLVPLSPIVTSLFLEDSTLQEDLRAYHHGNGLNYSQRKLFFNRVYEYKESADDQNPLSTVGLDFISDFVTNSWFERKRRRRREKQISPIKTFKKTNYECGLASMDWLSSRIHAGRIKWNCAIAYHSGFKETTRFIDTTR